MLNYQRVTSHCIVPGIFHPGFPYGTCEVYSIVQKYGQGVHPAVTAMTGNPEDLFSNQQGQLPSGYLT